MTDDKNSLSLSSFRKSYADHIIAGELARAKAALEQKGNTCPAKELCLPNLENVFKSLLDNLHGDSLSAEQYVAIRKKLEEAESRCTLDACPGCLAEADRIFAELTKLLKDTGIYTGTPEDIQIQDLPEDDVTTLIGEPLANSMRVRILKALAGDSKMFADIAALTGLRGGNLKFHLEKLMSSNLITQKNERDKYQITDRGRELLLAAAVLLDKIR